MGSDSMSLDDFQECAALITVFLAWALLFAFRILGSRLRKASFAKPPEKPWSRRAKQVVEERGTCCVGQTLIKKEIEIGTDWEAQVEEGEDEVIVLVVSFLLNQFCC